MADPFLLAHEVAPLLFDVGGRVSPVSIRDQMIRGQMIADRAVEAGLINAATRPLLVVGAGAAGATAAIQAARKSVLTVLIDNEPGPFSRQIGCASRWIDPTQYDWPVDHWPVGRYPTTSSPVPLRWSAGRANAIAIGWQRQLNIAASRYPLVIHYSTSLTRKPTLGPPGYIAATISGPKFPIPTLVPFGMVLSAAGFGTEQTTLGNFSGFQFWDTDDFEKANCGLSTLPRILISGGGDGGLQDFLRITTGLTAEQIYRTLKTLTAGSALNWPAIEHHLQSAEDQAQRAYALGATKNHDHNALDTLHGIYVDEVGRLKSDTVLWPGISAVLSKLIRHPLADVTLVHHCSHFGPCYGLNRFLVLLLDAFLQDQKGTSALRDRTGTVAVSGVGHTCAKNPAACHGLDHDVTFGDADCSGSGLPSGSQRYNVVILRHGIDPPSLTHLPTGSAIPFPRLLLPYHIV